MLTNILAGFGILFLTCALIAVRIWFDSALDSRPHVPGSCQDS